MNHPISLTDLRASIATLPADRQVILRADELVALVDAIEAAHRELAALETWAAEQNAGNAFADQVRQWAITQRAKLTARFTTDLRRERIEQAIHGLTTEANRLRQTLNDDGPR